MTTAPPPSAATTTTTSTEISTGASNETSRAEASEMKLNQFLSDLLSPSPFNSSIEAEQLWYNKHQQPCNLIQQISSNQKILQSAVSFLHKDQESLKNLIIFSSIQNDIRSQEQRDDRNGNDDFVTSSPSWSWLELQMVSTVRLATLLIHASSANIPTNNSKTYGPIAEEILQYIAQRLTSVLQSMTDENSQDSDPPGSQHLQKDCLGIIRKYIFLLLTVIEPIAGLNAVCAMVWRIVCELASLLGRIEGGESVLLLAMDRILILIREGFQVALIHTDGNGTRNEDGNSTVHRQPGRMVKLLKFFLLRMMQLIPLLEYCRIDGDLHQDGKSTCADALGRYIAAMMEFRGMIVENQVEQRVDSAVQQLGTRVDSCIDKMLHRFRNDIDGDCDGGKSPILYSSRAIQMLIKIRPGSRKGNDLHFWIGKWFTLLTVLEQSVTAILQSQLRELSVADWNACVSLCDNILWQAIPMCHVYIALGSTFAADLLSKSIQVIGDALHVLERVHMIAPTLSSRDCQKEWKRRNHLHRVIIQWIGCRKGDKIHPLTKEVLLAIVQVHIIRSFERDHGTTSASACNSSSCNTLLRIMSKLLLNSRTGKMQRENVGIIVYRLMDISSPHLLPLKQRVESILILAFIDFLQKLKDPISNGKPKRIACTQWVSPTALSNLGPLMHRLSSSGVMWAKMGSSKRDLLLEDLSTLFLLDLASEEKRAKRMHLLISKAPVLLHLAFSLLDECACFPTPKKDQMRRGFFLALSQTPKIDSSDFALFRFARKILSSSKVLPQKEQTHFLKAMRFLSSKESSMRNKFGGAMLSSSLCSALSTNGFASVSLW